MPGFDGTGPRGMGPMTGGARGYCATGWGGTVRRGFGLRRWPRWGGGWGAGWRWDSVPPATDIPPVGGEAVDSLIEQIRVLGERVEALNARLDAAEGRER